MMRRLLLTLCLLAPPLLADPPGVVVPLLDLGPPLTATEFENYATGKTLSYAQGGTVWGSEHYLAGRRVLWAFTGQPCEHGQWYEDQGAICFGYEGKPQPNCWFFYNGATGLVARFTGGGSLLSEVGQSPEPMDCPGPQIGA